MARLSPLRRVLDALLPPTCVACDLVIARGDFCAPCLEGIEAPRHEVTAACAYGGPVAAAIRAVKFHGDDGRVPALSRLLCARLPAALLAEIDVVTWVPAPWRRRLSRGFDLPALLARALASAHQKPWRATLSTTRSDAPLAQGGNGADRLERQARVAGRYRARGDPRGQRLLLLDDVVTTGATLSAAAATLTAAGAVVTVAALAATPEDA